MASVAEPQILHPTPNHSSTQYGLADVGIEASPSLEKYIKRRALLASNRRNSNESLPTGFPEIADSPATWSSETLQYEDLLYTLSDREVAEVEHALDLFNGTYKVNGLCLSAKHNTDPNSFIHHTRRNLYNNIPTTKSWPKIARFLGRDILWSWRYCPARSSARKILPSRQHCDLCRDFESCRSGARSTEQAQ